ncbi:hypothetical protein G7054_g7310 [Neopestalotiopsis clavispora]|nr:hypothetical protein G7054_g7310 [Neopestalotiopsis clavispora]
MHFPGVALVTGAGSGIGRATAILYAKEGCSRIAVADINKSNADETAKEIETRYPNTSVLPIEVDITSEQSVNDMVSLVVRKFERLDYACNAAGVLIPGPTDEVPVSAWKKQIDVNLHGTWLCQRAEIIQMLKQDGLQADDGYFPSRGSIANVASMCALMAYDHLPAYCASKHAILGFTRADGMRYAKHGIRVNAICPGVTATPMVGDVPEKASSGSLDANDMMNEMATGRFGLPEEVAEAIVWVTSGRASLIIAGHLTPNGGMIGA